MKRGMATNAPKSSQCPNCGPLWDRRGNVKSIQLCAVHAAGPELLEVLQDLKFAYDHQHDRSCSEAGACIWKDAEEAIAKAEGKSHE